MAYVHWLIILSVAFAVLERLFPWRKEQGFLRKGLFRDLVFLAFNGHFFALLMAGVFAWAATNCTALLQDGGFVLETLPIRSWSLPLQFLVFFVLSDFLQWCVHNLLHRVPFLWTFHKVHHSVTTMDWIANFRFHWMEHVFYKSALFIPMTWLGTDPQAAFWVYVLSTASGHFNHSNLNTGLGPLGYIFNSPRMHLWHHDKSKEGGIGKNYAIVFSLWDWIFRTAYWPKDRSPEKLGFPGMAKMPMHLPGQMLWPLWRR